MPHIHTEPGQHDHTVTAYILRDDALEPKTLLHMHKRLGRLLPIGGHIELNETPWAALIRELGEESGYNQGEVDVMQPELRIPSQKGIVVHPQPMYQNTHSIPGGAPHFHSDSSYLLLAHGSPSGAIAEGESSDLRWLSVSQIRELSPDLIDPEIKEVCILALQKYLTAWRPVPAANYRTDEIWR